MKNKVIYINPDELKAGLEMLLDERDRYRDALEAFLNPEKMGYAVTESVRDHVRGVLGIERVSKNA